MIVHDKSEIVHLFNRLGHKLFQFAVEHPGDFRHLRVAELAEEQQGFVVFHTRLALCILVNEHPQRRVEGGSNVVLRHLKSKEGFPTRYWIAFLC